MIGDQKDLIARLQRWLPTAWFPTEAGTRIYSIVAGFASLFVTIYQDISYATLQTRLATARDGFLDLASQDFFGGILPRLNAEVDQLFSGRIRREVFRDRQTRSAIDALIVEMTGAHPLIVELERPADVGCWGSTMAWGHARYGSEADHFTTFITCKHAGQFGIPNVGGWGGYMNAWGTNRMVYAGPEMIAGTGFTDAQMMEALNRLRAAGCTFWVNITNVAPDPIVPLYELGDGAGNILGTEGGAGFIL